MKNARARTPKAIFRGNSDRDNGCSDSDGAIIDRRLRRQPSRAVGPRRKTPNNGFLGVMNLIAGRRKEHGEVGQRRSPRLSKPLATGYWRPRRLSSCVSTSLCARAVLPSASWAGECVGETTLHREQLCFWPARWPVTY